MIHVKKSSTYTISDIKRYLQHDEVDDTFLQMLRKDKRKGVIRLLEQYERKKARLKAQIEAYDQLFIYEKEWKRKGYEWIAGLDEAGRGPLAGPVTAAAVILPENIRFPGLTDSKQLSKAARHTYEEEIKKHAIAYHVTHVSAQDIDDMNIYEATKVAMRKAVAGLHVAPDLLFIDALTLDVPIKQLSLTKGDCVSASIAAASILAKVERDRYMETLALRYPHYGFEKHKGYGTKEHLEALRTYGPTEEHRTSFAPVQSL